MGGVTRVRAGCLSRFCLIQVGILPCIRGLSSRPAVARCSLCLPFFLSPFSWDHRHQQKRSTTHHSRLV